VHTATSKTDRPESKRPMHLSIVRSDVQLRRLSPVSGRDYAGNLREPGQDEMRKVPLCGGVMGDKFAKIFEVKGEQVLIFTEYESDTDETMIHHITLIDGVTAHEKITITGEDQDTAADKYLKSYDQAQAVLFRTKMIEMLSEE